MSLLLEALNRSESERHERESKRGLHPRHSFQEQPYQPSSHYATPGATIINTGNQTPWFVVILCFNALLFVVAGLFWFQLENQKSNNDMLLFSHLMNKTPTVNSQQHTPGQDKELAQLAIEEAHNQLSGTSQQKRDISAREPVAQVTLEDTHQSVTPPLPTGKTEDRNKLGTVYRSTRTLNSDEPPDTSSVIHNDTIYQLHTLPPDLAASFPQLHYNAHLYSPDLPSARMVMINNTQYSEKDKVQKDLIIDQITPNGVIYRFKNVQLRVNVVSELQ